jgi:hypothetical protein
MTFAMALRQFLYCIVLLGSFFTVGSQANDDAVGEQGTPDIDKMAIAMACEADPEAGEIVAIDKIAMLPLVPLLPVGEAAYAHLGDWILGGTRRQLVLKGYVLRPRDKYSEVNSFTPEDVSLMSVPELSSLGQDRDEYLLVVYLWSRKLSNPQIRDDSALNLSAKLIDKANAKCLWSDLAFVTVHIPGGVFSLSGSASLANSQAMVMGAKHLFRDFPEKNID